MVVVPEHMLHTLHIILYRVKTLLTRLLLCNSLIMYLVTITRGPRGPWVAHLRKRSKVTMEPIIENPRGIIWTTLEDLLMMLDTKYESSRPCSFRQEVFWKFHFKTYLLTPWPTYATNWNGLNKFDRGPPRNHSCEVWSNSN